MLRILITSVGSLVGYNILDTLEGRRQELMIIGTNSIAAEANVYRCDKAYIVPSTRNQEASFTNRLLEIIELEVPDLIIPARDDDLLIVAEIRSQRPELADAIMCGSKNSVEILTDKWSMHRFAEAYGLPSAASAIPNPEDGHAALKQLLAEYGYPILAKPRRGFGSLGVSIIANDRQLNAALELEGIVFQQFLGRPEDVAAFTDKIQKEGIPLYYSLESDKYSLQTFVRRDKSVSSIFCTLHKMVSGRSLKVERVNNPVLEDVAWQYATAMSAEGWFGPLNIQCQRLPSGEFAAHELNGRFTGATSARYYLGFDEVGDALKNLSGWRLEPGKRSAVHAGLVSRYVTTLPVPDEAVEKLRNQSQGQAFAPPPQYPDKEDESGRL